MVLLIDIQWGKTYKYVLTGKVRESIMTVMVQHSDDVLWDLLFSLPDLTIKGQFRFDFIAKTLL